MWKAHFKLLSDIDELNQCKRTFELQQEGEDVSELSNNEAAFIVDPSNIAADIMQLEMKEASALAVLRGHKQKNSYLKGQRTERKVAAAASTNQTSLTNSNASDSCEICLAGFDSERSVLHCGHSFHPACVDKLFKTSAGSRMLNACQAEQNLPYQ